MSFQSNTNTPATNSTTTTSSPRKKRFRLPFRNSNRSSHQQSGNIASGFVRCDSGDQSESSNTDLSSKTFVAENLKSSHKVFTTILTPGKNSSNRDTSNLTTPRRANNIDNDPNFPGRTLRRNSLLDDFNMNAPCLEDVEENLEIVPDFGFPEHYTYDDNSVADDEMNHNSFQTYGSDSLYTDGSNSCYQGDMESNKGSDHHPHSIFFGDSPRPDEYESIRKKNKPSSQQGERRTSSLSATTLEQLNQDEIKSTTSNKMEFRKACSEMDAFYKKTAFEEGLHSDDALTLGGTDRDDNSSNKNHNSLFSLNTSYGMFSDYESILLKEQYPQQSQEITFEEGLHSDVDETGTSGGSDTAENGSKHLRVTLNFHDNNVTISDNHSIALKEKYQQSQEIIFGEGLHSDVDETGTAHDTHTNDIFYSNTTSNEMLSDNDGMTLKEQYQQEQEITIVSCTRMEQPTAVDVDLDGDKELVTDDCRAAADGDSKNNNFDVDVNNNNCHDDEKKNYLDDNNYHVFENEDRKHCLDSEALSESDQKRNISSSVNSLLLVQGNMDVLEEDYGDDNVINDIEVQYQQQPQHCQTEIYQQQSPQPHEPKQCTDIVLPIIITSDQTTRGTAVEASTLPSNNNKIALFFSAQVDDQKHPSTKRLNPQSQSDMMEATTEANNTLRTTLPPAESFLQNYSASSRRKIDDSPSEQHERNSSSSLISNRSKNESECLTYLKKLAIIYAVGIIVIVIIIVIDKKI